MNDRPPGLLVTLDGPGGVGKSTTARLIVDALAAEGLPVLATAQPSRSPLGELARYGTDTSTGMALACLCAADRHHQLDIEILPALRDGTIVVCDRSVASSLVLQGLDGLTADTVWALNQGVHRSDLAVILTADPHVIAARLRGRGGHSRFERAADNSERESALYVHAIAELRGKGWPVMTVDCTAERPETIAAMIVTQIHRVLKETPVCR
ncbi:dTMP kinase [Actinokineospora sp. 24-640]